MKIRTDQVCPKSGEEEETAYHLDSYSDTTMACYSIFDSYLMDIMSCSKFNRVFCWGLQELRRDLYNVFGYLGAAHWDKTDYGLSVGRYAILPEYKGNGKRVNDFLLPCHPP